ncbi:MAG: OB-fold domain-containing protein [Actinobacteria bacterium]|nr:OB-fold domain-containing protein [Actinomycetota bacterium]
MGREPDPWADFRSIEILDLEWSQHYRHSLGKYSRFFLELEQGRFLATRCPHCEKVWATPRPLCPDDRTITEWFRLTAMGTLVGFSVLHRPVASIPDLTPPYVLAYVALDGADTLFLHVLDIAGDITKVAYGMRVRIVFRQGQVDHPIWLMRFEPAGDTETGS